MQATISNIDLFGEKLQAEVNWFNKEWGFYYKGYPKMHLEQFKEYLLFAMSNIDDGWEDEFIEYVNRHTDDQLRDLLFGAFR